MSPRLAVVAGVGALAAVVVAGTATRPAAQKAGAAASASSRPVTRVQLVCPGLDGSAQAPVQISAVDAGPLLAAGGAPSVRVTLTPLSVGPAAGPARPATATALSMDPASTTTFAARLTATVVTAVGAGAGNVVASQHQLVPDGPLRGLVSAPCLRPTTDSWLTGADGRVGHSDVLVVANPGSTDAAVTVTAWAETGPLDLPGLQSLSVPAGHSVELTVADYAPDAGLVSFHVHADTGRVAAEVRSSQSAGLSATGTDWLPPTQPPARHLVVPGYQSGAGPRLLVVTNPGHADATVRLRLIAQDRAFVPAGHPDLVVAPGRSALVDLSTSLGGTVATAELTSDQPVLAAGSSQATAPGGLPDLDWLPATSALARPGVLAENTPSLGGTGVLVLTAVGQPATVRLVGRSGQAHTVQLGADRTVSVDLTSALGDDGVGPVAVVPVSGAVFAARSMQASGAHGPLLTAIVPTELAAPIRLPAVRQDLRVAVR
jgi:hypothetical protein